MRRLAASLAAGMIAATAMAEEVLVSPSEFRSYADGHTLYFELNGQPFGAEQFVGNRETIWRYRDGSCINGAWRVHGAQICFLYGRVGEADVLCWRVLRDDEGMLARLLTSDHAGLELRILGRDKREVQCSADEPAT